MRAQPETIAEDARILAAELDAINERSLVEGPASSERIAAIIRAHRARVADLAGNDLLQGSVADTHRRK